jgi:hypothetical protein
MAFEGKEPFGCATCKALCCKDIDIALTAHEAVFMRAGNTDLEDIVLPEQVNDFCEAEYLEFGENALRKTALRLRQAYPKGTHGAYRIKGRCGYAGNDDSGREICTIHESLERPDVCKVFEEGGPACQAIRIQGGLSGRLGPF